MNDKSKSKLENLLDDLVSMVVSDAFDDDERKVVLNAIDELYELTIT